MSRDPTNHEFERAWTEPVYALCWPAFWVTSELLNDLPQWFEHEPWWYARAWHSYDLDMDLYVLSPLAPFVWAYQRWKYSATRFCVERAMRGRIADKPEGDRWTSWTWKFRHPRDWTWKRTRRHCGS